MSVARAKATAKGTLGFTVDWSVFEPKEQLPDTGPRTFQVGDVYAVHDGDVPMVIGIVSVAADGCANFHVLSGCDAVTVGLIGPSVDKARHAQRIDAPVAKMWAEGLRRTGE